MNAADIAVPALSRAPSRSRTALRLDAQALTAFGITAASSIQFCILAWISFTQVARGSLPWDFARSYQAFYAISNGRLDSFDSLAGLPFVKIHASVLMWPLATIGAFSASPLTLKLISAAAAALATLVGLGWAREIVERQGGSNARTAGAILIACIAVAVLDPWTYQSSAFDVNFSSVAALAAVGLGRALYNGSTGAACGWMLLGVLAGDISTTVVTATAFGCALALPYARQAGFGLAAAGAVAFGAVEIQGFAVGDDIAKNFPYVRVAHGTPNAFAVLSWLLAHPAFVAARISEHGSAILSNLAPSGVVGLVCPFTALPTALVLFENVMTTGVHDAPGAAELAPAFYLLLPGLAWTLVGLARVRLTALVIPASLLVAVNCAGWFGIWFPLLGSQAVLVSSPASTALEDLHDRIGDKDGVVASDHFIGSFADREFAYGFRGGQHYAIHTRTFVALSARDGASPDGWVQTYAGIAALLRQPGARLVSVSQGLWIFEFPRATTHTFDPPATAASLPAGVLNGDVGRRDVTGGALESDGRAGYLVRDAIWRDPPGRYAARITATGPMTVEAWDASRNTLLAREQIDHAGVAVVPFELPYHNSTLPIAGAPVFRHGGHSASDGNDWIEVRVAVAKDAHTRVEQVGLDGDQGLVPNF